MTGQPRHKRITRLTFGQLRAHNLRISSGDRIDDFCSATWELGGLFGWLVF